MQTKPQSISESNEFTGQRYIPAEMTFTSMETDCSFLSASYLVTIEGQEKGMYYDMSTEDDSGNIYNPDWDYCE